MATIDLTQYGITGTTEIVHNPDFDQLFREELRPDLEGYERGQVTEMGDAVNVMTGIYTGRSPKDKYIVDDDTSRETVWWTSDAYKNDNKRASQKAWNAVRDIAIVSCATSASSSSMRSAVRMSIRACPSASLWKYLGRRISSRICSSARRRRN